MKAQLRNHPKLKYHGARTWPPDLGGVYDSNTRFPMSEEGILKEVTIVTKDLIGPERLDLTVEYDGRKHSGQVWVDDPTLVPTLRDVLAHHIDEPMNQIGALEVDL
jgi:hypothetical protein